MISVQASLAFHFASLEIESWLWDFQLFYTELLLTELPKAGFAAAAVDAVSDADL